MTRPLTGADSGRPLTRRGFMPVIDAKLRRALWLALTLLAHGAWAQPPQRITQPPQRIISLTPHLTELLFAIGAGAQVVATDDASDWPPQVKTLPHVANYQSINLESLLAMKPDLVVIWSGYPRQMIDSLTALRIPLLVVDSRKLTDLPRDLRLLGKQSGHQAQADRVAQQSETRFAALRQRYQARKPVRLFYQLWSPPLTTVAKGSWIQEAIELCGGENAFVSAATAYPQISEEAVLVSAPQLIISTQGADSLSRWRRWPQLPAVAHNQLQLSNPDRLHRLTPRTLDGIEELCQLIDQAR